MQRFFRDLKRYYRYMLYASKAELKSEVSNSYLNWLWWILEPVCFMLIYVFMVQIIFKTSEPYFPVFVLIGLTAWNYFNKTIKTSIKFIKSKRGVIIKIYVPKFVFVLIEMFVNTFKMLISFVIIIIMMVVYHVPFTWSMFYFLPILIILNVFLFGFCMLLMHFGVFIGDLSNIMNIALRFLFYLSGIFYSLVTRLPKPYGKIIVRINPIAFIINQMRNVMLYEKTPDFKFWVAWLVVGLILSCVGIIMVYKNENSYAKVI